MSPTQDPPDLWNRSEYLRRGLQGLPKVGNHLPNCKVSHLRRP